MSLAEAVADLIEVGLEPLAGVLGPRDGNSADISTVSWVHRGAHDRSKHVHMGHTSVHTSVHPCMTPVHTR